jgi:hypothetical protein
MTLCCPLQASSVALALLERSVIWTPGWNVEPPTKYWSLPQIMGFEMWRFRVQNPSESPTSKNDCKAP